MDWGAAQCMGERVRRHHKQKCHMVFSSRSVCGLYVSRVSPSFSHSFRGPSYLSRSSGSSGNEFCFGQEAASHNGAPLERGRSVGRGGVAHPGNVLA